MYSLNDLSNKITNIHALYLSSKKDVEFTIFFFV